MFVRADKLILDRRGRAARMDKAETIASTNKCALKGFNSLLHDKDGGVS